jgi:hypothetical protein
MTISQNFSSVRPSLLLDFANTEQLDPRITFSRPTTATYYDNHTTVVAEQNLALNSQSVSFVSGASTGLTLTGNTTVAPDGTTTGTTAAFAATTSYGYQAPSVPQILGTTYTFSAWLWTTTSKATIGIRINANLNGADQTFATVNLTSTPTRVSVTRTFTSSDTNIQIGFDNRVGVGGDGIAGSIVYWGAQLEQRSSVTAYTPTTTAPITNYIPVLLTQQSNEARFDHNPTTRESLGLLIEEQRTNLVTYSEQFDNAAWGKANVSITANTIIAPDGALTGDKLVESTASNFHFIYPTSSGTTNGTTYTASIYAKAAERTWFVLTAYGVSGTDTWFNLSTGVSGATGSSVVSKSISPVGNGWYRCSITYVATGTNNGVSVLPATANAVSNYTGDGYSGIYIWGAQLEAGAFATSYIPTVASQVTRSADSASMTGANFSSWYNNAEGSFYVDAVASSGSYATYITDGTDNNYIVAGRYASSGTAAVVTTNTVIQVNFGSGVLTGKVGFAYKVNDFAVSTNSGTVATDNSGSIPVVNQMRIGSANSGLQINGTMKKLAYYPIRVTNAQLQGLTG